MKLFSVIICTYNPSRDIFQKCLQALSAANLSSVQEIILVDNNSSLPLAEQDYIAAFLSLHPIARIVVEKKQGLTPARLKGITEASGEALVFIDDDNFVYPDFFEAGAKIAVGNPHIGSWSGQVKLLFEQQPEEWTKRYWGLLVHREFTDNKWSNFPHLPDTMPCGAGLFVRKQVAQQYHTLHSTGQRSIQLDRTGESLFSGGDNDLAACACDINMGVGLFSEIILEHYIPKSRLTRQYLLRLAEDIYASAVVFKFFRDQKLDARGTKRQILDMIRMFTQSPIERAFHRAVLRGEKKGIDIIQNNKANFNI